MLSVGIPTCTKVQLSQADLGYSRSTKGCVRLRRLLPESLRNTELITAIHCVSLLFAELLLRCIRYHVPQVKVLRVEFSSSFTALDRF